jgi:hypothetical protein
MPPRSRYTVRLPRTLAALVADRVRQGHRASDIIRDALEAYFGVRPPDRPTPATLPAAVADEVSAIMSDKVSAIAADVSDMRERSAQLKQQVEHMSAGVGASAIVADMTSASASDMAPSPAASARQASPQILGSYDPGAAAVRIQELRGQGFSFARIAAQLDAEGMPTRHGGGWHRASVRHLWETYG